MIPPWASAHQTLHETFELICMTKLNTKTVEYIWINIILIVVSISKHGIWCELYDNTNELDVSIFYGT